MNSPPLSVLKVCTLCWNFVSIALSRSIRIFTTSSLCFRLNENPNPEQSSLTTRQNLTCVHLASGFIGPIKSACRVPNKRESRFCQFSKGFSSIFPRMQSLQVPDRCISVTSMPLTDFELTSRLRIVSPRCPSRQCQVAKSVADVSLLTALKMLSWEGMVSILTPYKPPSNDASVRT